MNPFLLCFIRYCQRHIKYNTTQEEFWNFSIDQMAAFDIPAMINYTVSLTKQSKIFFFGHSQGAMVLFARLSSDMDLSSKIKLFLAVGPVAHLSNLIGPIKYVAEFGLDRWFELFGRKDFLPSNALTQDIADKLCGHFWIDEILCKNGINIISGPSDNLNTTRIPVYLSHCKYFLIKKTKYILKIKKKTLFQFQDPAGTSTKTINHYSQLVVNKKFQMYDYGAHDNLIFYNQSTAPIYDIRKIQVPVALYTGGSDWLADLNDVNILRQSLPNIVDDYTVEGWDHSDLVWATNATLVYYKRMIQFMSKFK